MIKQTPNFRLIFACFMAASVALPVAIISIAKFLLLLCGLVTLMQSGRESKPTADLNTMFTPLAILSAVFILAASLFWTTAPESESLVALAKHGKLIMIPLLASLIRTRREALIALTFFVMGQLFLMLSTLLLVMEIPLFWSKHSVEFDFNYAVFSSYLDQSIMTAVFAAVCWHLRGFFPGRHGKKLAAATSIIALACVFFVFRGRTGHAVAITVISLTIMWALPRNFRISIIVIPFLVLLVMTVSSEQVRTRLMTMSSEIQAYSENSEKIDPHSSSGIRLKLWHRSLQAIEQHPILGSGVGSWHVQYNQIEKGYNPQHTDIRGNPHQEYLMWGVELGLPGIALLCAVMFSVYRDSLRMTWPTRRALQLVLAALAVACLFNSSLYDALIGDFFCVAIGLLMALGVQQNHNHMTADTRFLECSTTT